MVLSSVLWIAGASALGWAISALFSGWLKLSRRVFLIPYVLLSALFLVFYFLRNETVTSEFWIDNWYWGLLFTLLAGVFLVKNILTQPHSQTKRGIDLWGDVVLLGLVYGIIDGLFLNVMPVVAVWEIFTDSQLSEDLTGKILIGFLALVSSLLVTLFYHLGYTEFRNKSILKVLLGNTIITLTFLLSGNPLAAVLTHTIMHVAAVFRGPETTLQLPPHYS